MDLMQRRRVMLAAASASEPELYPIGTDVVNAFIKANGGWKKGKIDAQGVFSSPEGWQYYASDIYIPVRAEYRYAKNNYRIGVNGSTGRSYAAWYDENKNFISAFMSFDTIAQNLPAPPSNARFLRLSTFNWVNSNNLTVTRIA